MCKQARFQAPTDHVGFVSGEAQLVRDKARAERQGIAAHGSLLGANVHGKSAREEAAPRRAAIKICVMAVEDNSGAGEVAEVRGLQQSCVYVSWICTRFIAALRSLTMNEEGLWICES